MALAERAAHHRRLAARRVDHRSPREQERPEAGHLLEHVGERNEREQPLMRSQREDLRRRERVREDVVVCEHRALRLAGRTRREHDLRDVRRRDVGLLERLLRTCLVGEELHVEERNAERLGAAARLPRHDRRARARARADLLDELDGRVDVERHEDRTHAQEREHRDPVLRTVHAERDDAVAFAHARVDKGPRHARDHVREVAVRPGERPEARFDHERVLGPEPPRGRVEHGTSREVSRSILRSVEPAALFFRGTGLQTGETFTLILRLESGRKPSTGLETGATEE